MESSRQNGVLVYTELFGFDLERRPAANKGH
jgi:hypothetical protein